MPKSYIAYMESKDITQQFLASKRVEGRSDRTLFLYKYILTRFARFLKGTSLLSATSDDIKSFLLGFREKNRSNTTMNNIRRVLNSFYAWCEEAEFLSRNPCKRVHAIKQQKKVKYVIDDETLELLRLGAGNIRNTAIINFLYITGVRVGELVGLKISDVDFYDRSCIVTGKDNKQRRVYFDARTKILLDQYLKTREDACSSLFAALRGKLQPLTIASVEHMVKTAGAAITSNRIYPHLFRRTVATDALRKGMPVEQIQKMLGHENIETTMQYAMVAEDSIKEAHRKYIG